MQHEINANLLFVNSDTGFSFDELVLRLQEVLQQKGYRAIIELIITLVQDKLFSKFLIQNGLPHLKCPCGFGEFHRHGNRKRTIRCSLGEVAIQRQRVRCVNCKRTHYLLDGFMDFGRYQTKSNELEQIVVEAACGTSYRRAVKDLGRDHIISIPHTTAHDWVMKTDCSEIELSNRVIGSLPLQVLADGTKFKGEGVNSEARKGDLKVIIGINTDNHVFPLGTYAGHSWEDINKEWKKHQIKMPDGSILISDGEPGLAKALASYAEEHQRCHWHLDRDLYHAYRQDGALNDVSKPIREALRGVLAIELPKEDFKLVTESEKDEIEERMEKAEQAIGQLIQHLEEKDYTAAATYLENAKRGMFGYVRRWLKWGIVSPRASSMIERVMREIGRRLKKIAYGWSDRGAEKIAKIILKRFTQAKEWEQYWLEKLKIDNKVQIYWRWVEHIQPHFGH
jgi:hypothetical protein